MTIAGTGYLAAGALLLAIATGAGGYFHGVDVGQAREQESQRKAVDKANADRDRLRTQIETAAIKHVEADQQRQATQREIIRESTQVVERPVYRTQCVDADGVRLLDRSAAAANGADGRSANDGNAAGAAEGPPD